MVDERTYFAIRSDNGKGKKIFAIDKLHVGGFGSINGLVRVLLGLRLEVIAHGVVGAALQLVLSAHTRHAERDAEHNDRDDTRNPTGRAPRVLGGSLLIVAPELLAVATQASLGFLDREEDQSTQQEQQRQSRHDDMQVRAVRLRRRRAAPNAKTEHHEEGAESRQRGGGKGDVVSGFHMIATTHCIKAVITLPVSHVGAGICRDGITAIGVAEHVHPAVELQNSACFASGWVGIRRDGKFPREPQCENAAHESQQSNKTSTTTISATAASH